MIRHMPKDWRTAVQPHIKDPAGMHTLEAAVRAEYQNHVILPNRHLIFRALEVTPYADVKAVILGQDPYPTPGHATGMAFSVPPSVKIARSLANIFKERESDLGIPASTSGDLTPWAARGVLLLNTILTVRAGAAGSHKNIGWQSLTEAIIQALNDKPHPIVYILWGGHAHAYAPMIDTSKHIIIQSSHPSPLGAYKSDTPFFSSNCFSRANAALAAHALPPIDWSN